MHAAHISEFEPVKWWTGKHEVNRQISTVGKILDLDHKILIFPCPIEIVKRLGQGSTKIFAP